MKSLAEYVSAIKNGVRGMRARPAAWSPQLRRKDQTDLAAAEGNLKKRGWEVTRHVTDTDEKDGVKLREEELKGTREAGDEKESLKGMATTREGEHFSEHRHSEVYTYERKPKKSQSA